MSEAEDDTGAGVDESATANMTIKDVTWRTRRRFRRYAKRHGLAIRETLDRAIDALEDQDNRTQIIGPTIEGNGADTGQPGRPTGFRRMFADDVLTMARAAEALDDDDAKTALGRLLTDWATAHLHARQSRRERRLAGPV